MVLICQKNGKIMIKNQTPNFAHDFNATMDPKVQDMLFDLGPSGFVYWAIVETLWQQQGKFPLSKIRNIALVAHAKPSLIEKVIKDYGLFEYDEEYFWSPSQLARQKQRNNLIASRQEAGRKGGKTRHGSGSGSGSESGREEKQEGSKSEAEVKQSLSNKLNKTKVNEIKGNEDTDADASSPGEPEGGALFSEEKQGRITATQFVDVWNRVIAETQAPINQVEPKALSEKAREKVQVRIREMARLGPPLEVLETVMRRACASRFCCGASNSDFIMKFGWLIKNGENWRKVYQGNYDDNKPTTPATGYDRLHIPTRQPEDYEGDF